MFRRRSMAAGWIQSLSAAMASVSLDSALGVGAGAVLGLYENGDAKPAHSGRRSAGARQGPHVAVTEVELLTMRLGAMGPFGE
jgi:hypothetical protein